MEKYFSGATYEWLLEGKKRYCLDKKHPNSSTFLTQIQSQEEINPGYIYRFILALSGVGNIDHQKFIAELKKDKQLRNFFLRTLFKEETLNKYCFRINSAHLKIKIIFKVLKDYQNEKNKKLLAQCSLAEDMVEDIIKTNIMNISETITELCNRLDKDKKTQVPIPNIYGCLFKKLSENNLKNKFKDRGEKYLEARNRLFPKETKEIENKDFKKLSKKIRKYSDELIKFRNKVIVHKDKKRFETHLKYEKYLEIYKKITMTLNDISLITTYETNDSYSNKQKTKLIEKRFLNLLLKSMPKKKSNKKTYLNYNYLFS